MKILMFALVSAVTVTPALSATPAAQPPPSTSVGLIALGDEEAVGDAVAMLEQLLLAQDQVTLVERNQIDQVLAERRLALSLGSDAETWRDLSAVIPADVFVLLVSQAIENGQQVLLLRFIESRTGVILGGISIEAAGLEESVVAVADEVALAVHRTRVPDDQRVYIAFLGLRADTPSRAVDRQARMLSAVVQAQLARNAAITLLEREQVYLLTQEEALSGAVLKLRSAGLILRGSVKLGSDESQVVVTLNAQRPRGSSAIDSVTVDPNDLVAAAAVIVRLAAATADLSSEPAAAPPAADEASRLMALSQRFILFNTYFDYMENPNPEYYLDVVSFAEAAYALEPNEENTSGLIRALYHFVGSKVDLPPLLTQTARWEAHLRAAELALQRDRRRIESGNLSDDNFTTWWYTLLWIPRVPRPDFDDRQQVELWQRTVELHRRRLDLLTEAVADRSPWVRDRFHGNVVDYAFDISTSTDDFCQFAIRHHRLGDAAFAERINLPPDPKHSMAAAPEAVMTVYWTFRPQGDLDDYEPYLRFLESHPNPLAGIYAAVVRCNADRSRWPQVHRAIFDAAFDPQSELNLYFDRLEAHGRKARTDYALFCPSLTESMDAPTACQYWIDTLDRLKADNAQPLVIRWFDWVDDLLRLVWSVDPDRVGGVLDRVELAYRDAQDPSGDLRDYNRRQLRKLIADYRNRLAKRAPVVSNLWDAYDVEYYPVKQAQDRGASWPDPPHGRETLDLTPGIESKIDMVILQQAASDPAGGPSYLLLMSENDSIMEDGVKSTVYYLLRVSFDLQQRRLLTRFVLPNSIYLDHLIKDVVAANDRLIASLGDSHGLLVVDDEARIYNDENGAPSNDPIALLPVRDHLYVSYPGVLAELDLNTGRFRTIASARSTENRSPLDNTENYEIFNLLQDSDHPTRLWFTAEFVYNRDLRGIWRYDADTGHLQQVEYIPPNRPTAGPHIRYLKWVEGRPVSGATRHVYAVDIDAMTYTLFDHNQLPPDRRRHYVDLDEKQQVMIGQHLFTASGLVDADGHQHHYPPTGLGLRCLWPSGDALTACSLGGFSIITRKPEATIAASDARSMALWVRDDDRAYPIVYIHGHTPRYPQAKYNGRYTYRFDFELRPGETVVLSGFDGKTGAMGFWMADVEGQLLSYSHPGMPVLPVEVAMKAQYEALPPVDTWERGRPIPAWQYKADELRTVPGAPDLPDDYAGIWVDSARGGTCTTIVYPLDRASP